MRRITYTIACICIVLTLKSTSYTKDWRGLVPLHSTRSDVERLIGKPTTPGTNIYDLKTERVKVVYSEGSCMKGWPYGWNVSPGTVLDITVYPKLKVKLADLHLDLSKYNNFTNPHDQDTVYYSSKLEGISIEIRSYDKEIISIQYLPTADDTHLLCPEAALRELSREKGESAYLSPALYYFNVSSREEKVRLDYFADQLVQNPSTAEVYIIGYGGRQACRGEAQNRANRVKNYLVKNHKIDAQRIVTIDGGHRDDVWVELYIVPLGTPKPLASPNIPAQYVQTAKGCKTKLNHRPLCRLHCKRSR